MNPWLAGAIVVIVYAIFAAVLMLSVCGRMNERGDRS